MRRGKRKEIFLLVTRGGFLDDLEEGWKKVKKDFLQTEIGKKIDRLISDPKEEESLETKIPSDMKSSLTGIVKKPKKDKSNDSKKFDSEEDDSEESRNLFESIFSDSKIFEDEEEKMAIHSDGKRNIKNLKWIVIHSTESDSASGTAEYFQSSHSTGSAHFVVGEDGVYRTLPDEAQPWGAPGANEEGLHIEVVGHAKFTREEWLKRKKTLESVKKIVQNWSSKYNIPLIFIKAGDLQAGESGVTTHSEVSKAFHKSTHWDPGPNFPMDKIL